MFFHRRKQTMGVHINVRTNKQKLYRRVNYSLNASLVGVGQRYFSTNKLYNRIYKVNLIRGTNPFRRTLHKLSLSHTHRSVSGEKRFGLTKTRNYKVFTYTELSRESSKVRHDSFFIVRAARTQRLRIQRKKGSAWTRTNLYGATKWNKMADRQRQQSSCWDPSANQRGAVRIDRIHFADIGFVGSKARPKPVGKRTDIIMYTKSTLWI